MRRVRALIDSRAFVPACLLVALILRLAVVALFPIPPIKDYAWYFGRATDIAAGHGVVFGGSPTAYWPAGYLFFLASVFVVTGPSVLAAQLANVALAIASLHLTHRIALRLTGSRLAAGVALAVLAIHPNQIAYVTILANETLLSFLVLAGVALLLRAHDAPGRWPRFAAAGAVFGLACLVKPQTVILPTVIIAWMAWRARPRYRGLAGRLFMVNAALAIVILPWTVRNYRVFGHFVFIANSGGVNLLVGNNPDAEGDYGNETTPKVLTLIYRPGANEYERDRIAARLAIGHALEHPLQVLPLVPKKLWHLYAKDADGFSWIEESAKAYGSLAGWKVVAQLYYLGLGALFVAALLWPRRGRHAIAPLDALPLVVVATFTAIYCVYFGDSRFHHPLMPWIAIYAAGFVAALAARAQVAVPAVQPGYAKTAPGV